MRDNPAAGASSADTEKPRPERASRPSSRLRQLLTVVHWRWREAGQEGGEAGGQLCVLERVPRLTASLVLHGAVGRAQ